MASRFLCSCWFYKKSHGGSALVIGVNNMSAASHVHPHPAIRTGQLICCAGQCAWCCARHWTAWPEKPLLSAIRMTITVHHGATKLIDPSQFHLWYQSLICTSGIHIFPNIYCHYSRIPLRGAHCLEIAILFLKILIFKKLYIHVPQLLKSFSTKFYSCLMQDRKSVV